MFAFAWILYGLVGLGGLVLVAVLVALARQAAAMRAEAELQGLGRESLSVGAPRVSVVVPARNEERNIAACLEALLGLDYPDFEILVVDDDSTDATAAIVAEFAARDARIRSLQLSQIARDPREGFRSGKSYVLAQAAREAQGEWLLFVDADTRQRKGR